MDTAKPIVAHRKNVGTADAAPATVQADQVPPLPFVASGQLVDDIVDEAISNRLILALAS